MLVVVGGVAVAEAQPSEDPSWKWPESRWRAAVEKVRSGRRLLPTSWPGGANVAVALSFDFDNETLQLRNGDTSPARLSTGEYGSRAALPRVLELLERYEIPATFFIPGVAAKLEEGGMLLLTLHPHIIGHRSRIVMLERLIQYMRSRPGVWFATHEQVARHAKEHG
jgi:peptidoglycan/xylan/chitin deacetylase (PgdA/CDA1 family)